MFNPIKDIDNELIKKCDKNWRIKQTFMKCHPIKVKTYSGKTILDETIANIKIKKVIDPNIDTMVTKYYKRIKNCKKQIDKFCQSSNKLSTLVQIRNDYECTELIAYVNTLNPELNLVATKYESHTLTDNKVKDITIILPNKDSECSKSECSCARTKIFVENNKVPTMYVLVQKKKIIC